ncbi:hypothetical protein [Shouchella clausii]|uniref:hypothetical protein n=1 Tax=Shouchella clausii TaxID=79880 RepID=UPI000BA6187B|nr:hypothetical protein [Shouchella clausii]PAD19116.1 hypothetical protein CHH73_03375 [Shouchella clausii]
MNTLREAELVIQNHYFAVRRYVYREGSVTNPDIVKVAQEAASRVRDGRTNNFLKRKGSYLKEPYLQGRSGA